MAGERGATDGARELCCLVGGAGTGKTVRLAARAAELAQTGADVLVVTAGPVARETFAARLAAHVGGEAAARVRVETPRTLELGLLDCDAARAHTGRRARLLCGFEVNALLEDVKTSGLRPGRLKEMLKFFYRGWTELADDDPAWLVTDEERGVHRLLKECLAFSGGVLEAELAGLAVRWLRDDPASLAHNQAAHVLVDDYQALNRASQVLAGMLARETLTVAGDPYACVQVCDPYPSAAGLAAFAQADGVRVERLGACGRGGALGEALGRLQGAVDATVAETARERAEEALLHRAVREMRTPDEQRAFEAEQGAAGAAESAAGQVDAACALGVACATEARDRAPVSVAVHVCATPDDEAFFVADRVRRAVADGADPADVCVAAPTRAHAASLQRALAGAGLAYARTPEVRAFAADVRDLRRCTAARLLTLLELAADPADDGAWRCWCGFGDWLANSPGFAALRAMAARSGEALHVLLAGLDGAVERGLLQFQPAAADERASLARVLDAYRAARGMLGELVGLEGRALVERAARCVAAAQGAEEADAAARAALGAVLPLIGTDGDARTLVERARHALVGAGFGEAPGAVRVATFEEAAGLAPRLTLAVGLVDGLLPAKDCFDEVETAPLRRLQLLVDAQRRLYAALGTCAGAAELTAFELVEQPVAQRMNLRVRRVRAVDGRPFACVCPSALLGVRGLGVREG